MKRLLARILLFLSESTQFRPTRVFFPHHFLVNSMTNWPQISTGLLIYGYDWIHQVRTLVFNNYQKCPVSLMCKQRMLFGSWKLGSGSFAHCKQIFLADLWNMLTLIILFCYLKHWFFTKSLEIKLKYHYKYK